MPEEAPRSAPRRSSAPSADHGNADEHGTRSPQRDDHQATRDRVLASLLSCPNAQTTRANGIGVVAPSQ